MPLISSFPSRCQDTAARCMAGADPTGLWARQKWCPGISRWSRRLRDSFSDSAPFRGRWQSGGGVPAGQAPWLEISVRTAVRVTTALALPLSPAVVYHQEGGGAPATLALVVDSCCSRPHSLTSRDRLSCLLPCGRLSRAQGGIEAEGAGNDVTPEEPPS